MSFTIFLVNHCSKHTPKASAEYLTSHLFCMNYIKLKYMIVKLKKKKKTVHLETLSVDERGYFPVTFSKVY